MSNNIFICKICGKSYNGLFPVGKHLKRIHNMTVKEYYDKFIKTDENEGKCLNCGNPTSFHRISDGYLKYCSNRCQNLFQNKEKIENKQKIEQEKHEQCIKQFGEDTKVNRIKLSFKNRQDLTNSPVFIDKIEKLYGVKYYCQTEKFKNEKAIRDLAKTDPQAAQVYIMQWSSYGIWSGDLASGSFNGTTYTGTAAPWFGHSGGATQNILPLTVETLIDLGLVKRL